MSDAQIITGCETKLFLNNSQTAQLGKYVIKNDDYRSWDKHTKISIVLPIFSKIEWADSQIKLIYKKKEYVVQPIISHKRCNIQIPFEVSSKESIEIYGLTLRNVYFPTKKLAPKIFINNQPCEFSGFKGRMIKINPFNQHKLLLDEIAITDIRFDFVKPGRYIIGHRLQSLPEIYLSVGPKPSIIPKGQKLNIFFPPSISKNIVYNNGKINGVDYKLSEKIKVDFSDSDNGLCAKLTFNRPLFSGDSLKISNLFIHTDHVIVDPVSIQLRIPESSGSDIFTKHQLYIADPFTQLTDYPEVIVNFPSVELPELIIDAGKVQGGINASSDIYFELPKDVGFEWDRTVNQILVEGSAADKISEKVHFLNKTTIRIDVLSDFQPDDWLRIKGLKFALRIVDTDNIENLIKDKKYIHIHYCGYNMSSGLDVLSREIQIAHFTMQSSAPQVFYYKDQTSEANAIHFQVESNFSCFKPDEVLILTIPDRLSIEWSNRTEGIFLDGNMKSKVKNIKYIDPKRLGFVLANAVNPNDKLIINGLKTEGFFREGREKLGLYHSMSDLPLCVDTENWIVEKPYFNMSDDLSLFTGQTNQCYELTIKTQELNSYLKPGSEIWFRISEQYPVQFDLNQRSCQFDKQTEQYLSPDIKYISDKTIALSVIRYIPSNTTLKISNLWFGEPLQETDQFSQLQMSFNKGFSYVPCDKNISIVSTDDKCNQSVHLCTLVESNFNKSDFLIIELADTRFMQWDMKMTTNKMNVGQKKNYINVENVNFSNNYKTIKFDINKKWDINERIDFSGLYVSIKNNHYDLADKALISILYKNNYGSQEYRYHVPISYKEITPPEKYKRHIPGKTYINPFIKFKSENGKSLFIEKGNDILRIPDFYIQNGSVYATDMDSYNVFRRAGPNITVFLRKKQLETARSEAEKLIKDCPNLWKGYWALARVLKEDKNLINDARDSYQRAKELGFEPGMMWGTMRCEVIFIDDPNGEMGQYIEDGIVLFDSSNYLDAEEKFLMYSDLIDSLSYQMIGESNYWLGRVAYELHDYEYAKRYFETTQDYDYDFVDDRQEYSVSYLLEDCIRNIETELSEIDYYHPDISQQDRPVYEEQKPVLMTFHKPDGRQDRIVLLRQNQARKRRVKTDRFEDTFELKDKDEYTIQFKPIVNSIIRLTSVVLIGVACCTILFI
ncbi:MAG: hypothetical protein L6422_10990 [Candidatus Marinimicrobia bacterium]|nr:hypothetical protein [Candidatus Neomarinimicrobiota bacterium]